MRQRAGAIAVVISLAALLTAGAALAGCGGDSKLTVLGASSLSGALGEYAEELGDVDTSFAGSDQLAAQVERGAPADLIAAADTARPAHLRRLGLVEQPVVFARNRLVVAIPALGSVTTLADLARPGTRIAIGDPQVPVGAYARQLLGRLPADRRRAILANVRSEEPEVGSVLAKVIEGAADAGFVYITDVRAAGAALRMISLPERLQPEIAYAAAVLSDSERREEARRFLDGLLAGEGAAALRRAGFLAPP